MSKYFPFYFFYENLVTSSWPDVKELEFISALMQTGEVHRKDGSILAEDIVLFLNSKYGIKVDLETIQKLIVYDLAGCVSFCKNQGYTPVFGLAL